MVRPVKEAFAVTQTSHDARGDADGARSRTPLAVRVILIIIAVAALAAAVWSAWNIHAAHDSASLAATLTRTIDEAGKPDADLKRLLTQQRQTDARYDTLLGSKAALLPQLASSLEANAAVSKTLTERLAHQIDEDGKVDGPQSSGGTSTADADRTGAPALNEQERRKLEELLKNNETTNSDEETTSNNGKRGQDASTAGNQDAKPW